MLAEYVITSKLFYGFVHHSKKSRHANICAILLKLIEIEIQNCSVFCSSAIVVWILLFFKLGSRENSFITCYFSLNPCIAILRRCPSTRMHHHNLSEERSCKKAKRIGDSTRLYGAHRVYDTYIPTVTHKQKLQPQHPFPISSRSQTRPCW